MSRTALCVLTASVLAFLSVGISLFRMQVLGQETRVPAGPGNFKVTMLVRGKSAGDARLITACPLDFHCQHIFGEELNSSDLYPKIVEAPHGPRRSLHWTQRVSVPKGPT